jgi:hypothetical protein
LRNTLHPSSLLWSMAEQSTRKYLRDVPLPQEHVTIRLCPIAESRSTPLTEGKQSYSLSVLWLVTQSVPPMWLLANFAMGDCISNSFAFVLVP